MLAREAARNQRAPPCWGLYASACLRESAAASPLVLASACNRAAPLQIAWRGRRPCRARKAGGGEKRTLQAMETEKLIWGSRIVRGNERVGVGHAGSNFLIQGRGCTRVEPTRPPRRSGNGMCVWGRMVKCSFWRPVASIAILMVFAGLVDF